MTSCRVVRCDVLRIADPLAQTRHGSHLCRTSRQEKPTPPTISTQRNTPVTSRSGRQHVGLPGTHRRTAADPPRASSSRSSAVELYCLLVSGPPRPHRREEPQLDLDAFTSLRTVMPRASAPSDQLDRGDADRGMPATGHPVGGPSTRNPQRQVICHQRGQGARRMSTVRTAAVGGSAGVSD